MTSTISSVALLEGLRHEDNPDAWRELCNRYVSVLTRVARRAGLREQDAEDVVQETLAAFVESFRSGQYDGTRGRPRPWIRGILSNKIKEALRRLARPEVQVTGDGSSTGFLEKQPDGRTWVYAFDQEWERAIAAACIEEVRRTVDPRTFEAFWLYAYEGRPAAEVAATLKVTCNVVYISKNRVLSLLRRCKERMEEIW